MRSRAKWNDRLEWGPVSFEFWVGRITAVSRAASCGKNNTAVKFREHAETGTQPARKRTALRDKTEA